MKWEAYASLCFCPNCWRETSCVVHEPMEWEGEFPILCECDACKMVTTDWDCEDYF